MSTFLPSFLGAALGVLFGQWLWSWIVHTARMRAQIKRSREQIKRGEYVTIAELRASASEAEEEDVRS